jgi:hypothetical protein
MASLSKRGRIRSSDLKSRKRFIRPNQSHNISPAARRTGENSKNGLRSQIMPVGEAQRDAYQGD